MRLTGEDVSNLRAILDAGFADTTSDAIRWALRLAAKAAKRVRQ